MPSLGDRARRRAVPGPHRRTEEARALADRRPRARPGCARICARCLARLSFVMFGCVQEWLPTTMPAARSSRTMPGDCLTLLPDHEERRAHVQREQLGQDLRRVRPGPVVERQRDAALADGAGRCARRSCRAPRRRARRRAIAVSCATRREACAASSGRCLRRPCRHLSPLEPIGRTLRRRLTAPAGQCGGRDGDAAATSSTATAASSRRRRYLLIRLRLASSALRPAATARAAWPARSPRRSSRGRRAARPARCRRRRPCA